MTSRRLIAPTPFALAFAAASVASGEAPDENTALRELDDYDHEGRVPPAPDPDLIDYGGAFDGFQVTSDADPGL